MTENEAEAMECLANIICQYLVPEAYQKDTPAKTRAEDIANHLWRLGYRLIRPDELKMLTPEEVSEIELPTIQEVETFRDNPDNDFGLNVEPDIKNIAAYAIVFAIKATNAQLAADKKALGL